MMAAMKLIKPRPYKDFTHSLVIKLGGPSFLSQFQASLQRFEKDVFAKIPPRAIFAPEHCDLYLGKLKLKHLDSFSKFLHGLDYHRLLERATENAQSSPVVTKALDEAPSLSHVASLRIDLSGLATRSVDPTNATKLQLLPIDHTHRLHHFWSSLIDSFSAAGFPLLRALQEPHLNFVSTMMINWHKPSPYAILPNGKKRYFREGRVPRFDARELIKMYENEVWAKDVHLQRLSLLGIGSTERLADGNRVFKQPPEIDSVALP